MITIRRLTTVAELTALHHLEQEIWPGDPGVHVPALVAMVKNGGLALGAYDGDRLVGICYGFPGYRDGEVYLCSHVLGVLPAYRHAGVGERLKLAQRAAALAMGYRLVTWTYDPLLAPNAWLNVAKLGCVIRRYEPNLYGEMADALNAGLPSDRFVAEWWLTSPRVEERLAAGPAARPVAPPAGVPVVNPLPPDRDPAGAAGPVCAPPDLTLTAPRVLIHIPAGFQALRQTHPAAARAWRERTALAFRHYFAQGYHVAEFFRQPPAYLLVKGDPTGAG